ncbi:MAG: HD domain-containing protein, partial [Planctomycetes bacterium]|nr:HD domain-containing protein [Planctomycetota bacterium]
MMTDFRHKIIVDPVHGDIGLSELETKIINTRTFQRLRRLKQLGMASLVYPNAMHTRFGHSLGVLYVVSRFIEVCQARAEIKDEDVVKVRLAALLHDVGHYPYSHLMEHIDWERYPAQYMKKKKDGDEKGEDEIDRFPEHDKLSELIVTNRSDIKKTLKDGGI